MTKSDEWFTPNWLLSWLPEIALDPCWSEHSHVVATERYDITKGQDGLALSWEIVWPANPDTDIVFCNPPYSDCSRWVKRCNEQSKEHSQCIVSLIPAKPGEVYWKKYIWEQAKYIGFLPGRLKFDRQGNDKPGTGTFGSALIIWGNWETAMNAMQTIQSRSKGHKHKPYFVKALDGY